MSLCSLLFLVSSARVSHLSLASPLLTGGTCPQVPLWISQLLFKSISMLNSRWRGCGWEAGWALSPGMDGGGGWGGWEKLRHNNEPQLFHTADPPGWSTAPFLFSLTLSPGLAFYHSVFSPLAFFSFILLPSLSFCFFFLILSLTSILTARPRACSHFRWDLKRVVTRWYACVCLYVCVLCVCVCWILQPGSCYTY